MRRARATPPKPISRRLIRRGFRVAVAEQMEDPKTRTGKAPIRREVVRLVTPGTLTEDALLEAGRPNLLLALAPGPATGIGAAWLDVSTGLFETAALPAAELPALLGRLDPAEILAPATLPLGDWADRARARGRRRRRLWSPAAAWPRRSAPPASTRSAASPTPRRSPPRWRWTTCAPPRPAALPRLARPRRRAAPACWRWTPRPAPAWRSCAPARATAQHTLLAAVQRTLTAAGARLLAGWLAAPLTDTGGDRRAAGCLVLAAAPTRTPPAACAPPCARAPDIARALARLSLGRGGPRDLAALRDGLAAAQPAPLPRCDGPLPADPGQRARRPGDSIRAPGTRLLADALADPAPHRLDDGGAIRRRLRRRTGCRTRAARRQPPRAGARCSSTTRSATASPA